jgi:transcriptional regulator with XRE-family HTH domain
MALVVHPRLMIKRLEIEGFRRAEIARQSGLSRSTISRLANGKIQNPVYDTSVALQHAGDRLLKSNPLLPDFWPEVLVRW